LPTADTQKVPGPVKICVLKLPQVTTVPPVAVIKVPDSEISDAFAAAVDNQPFVAST